MRSNGSATSGGNAERHDGLEARLRYVKGEGTLHRSARLLEILLLAALLAACAGNAPEARAPTAGALVDQQWTDPTTGLTWAGGDNGRKVNWSEAMSYCRDLRLSGRSDWRLPSISELRGIHDSAARVPGTRAHESGPFAWRVKGNLSLSGYEWSSDRRTDERGRPIAYAYFFNFLEGRTENDQTGYALGFALCVRGPAGRP